MPFYMKNADLNAPIPGTPVIVAANPVVTSEGFSGAAAQLAAGRYTDVAPAGGVPTQWLGSSGGVALDGAGRGVRGSNSATWTSVLLVDVVNVQIELDVPVLPTTATLRILAKYPTTNSATTTPYFQATITSTQLALLSNATSAGSTTHVTVGVAAGDRVGLRVINGVISLLKNGAVVGSASPGLATSGIYAGLQGANTLAGFAVDNLVIREITDAASL